MNYTGIKTRYTTAALDDGYFVRDLFAKEGEAPFGPYETMKKADAEAKAMQSEWVKDLQECKDELFRSGALNRDQNHGIQSKLDKAAGGELDEAAGLERGSLVTHISPTTILGRPWKVSYMPPCPWYPDDVPGRFVIEENLGWATGKLLSKDGLWGITAIGFTTPEAAKAWAMEMRDA